ncbi:MULTISPECIES: DUF397 domain-containing protein [Streptomyces]|uniref:DUF397 domain-containing protein n=1 Tax=Streptomyces edwardsiae TaxID=3075527 RepID=A0ABU2Q0F2_9ACTN|nr:DUF397 domain-containing protein [Streptomyces sp. DSM 41636]MDT0397413.1 DUF397 domain-containing protein [Streptomyces sp. DSM 41636]
MPARPSTRRELAWFKSTYSGANTTECVECAHAADGTLIRDSKWAGGPMVHVARGPWLVFIRSLTNGAPNSRTA